MSALISVAARQAEGAFRGLAPWFLFGGAVLMAGALAAWRLRARRFSQACAALLDPVFGDACGRCFWLGAVLVVCSGFLQGAAGLLRLLASALR